jgi:hypothetical protein
MQDGEKVQEEIGSFPWMNDADKISYSLFSFHLCFVWLIELVNQISCWISYFLIYEVVISTNASSLINQTIGL